MSIRSVSMSISAFRQILCAHWWGGDRQQDYCDKLISRPARQLVDFHSITSTGRRTAGWQVRSHGELILYYDWHRFSKSKQVFINVVAYDKWLPLYTDIQKTIIASHDLRDSRLICNLLASSWAVVAATDPGRCMHEERDQPAGAIEDIDMRCIRFQIRYETLRFIQSQRTSSPASRFPNLSL